MQQEVGIFGKVKSYYERDPKGKCQLFDSISGRFDEELGCYAFYKQGGASNDKVQAIVYVTQGFLNDHNEPKDLEKTILDYLAQKKGMQATFKTSGIDELPLADVDLSE